MSRTPEVDPQPTSTSQKKFSNTDLKRWKREINPAPIFAARIKLSRENSEWVANCPPCYHEARAGHPDKTPSFKVYKMDDDTWGFKCFGCGAAGNVFQFVQKFDGVPFAEAVRRVLREAGEKGWEDGQQQIDADAANSESQTKPKRTFSMSEYQQAIRELEQSDEAKAWLAKRGISMDTARKFHVGFVRSAEKINPNHPHVNDGWITFPTLSDDVTITAIKYRSIAAKEFLRAPNTSTTLYNLQSVEAGKDVYLVEGEPDALVLAQAGLTAVALPSAAYKPTEDEIARLSTAGRIFTAGDTDAAGKKATADIRKRLKKSKVFTIEWPEGYKDANEFLLKTCNGDPAKFAKQVADLRADAAQELRIIDGDDLDPECTDWMWYGKIPFGKITLFAGNPDNGKSLSACSVAAIVSRGAAFPNGGGQHEPADALMMIGEDELKDTVIPRLQAAGADMKRIKFVDGVGNQDQEIELDIHLPKIKEHLDANPNTKLIVVDPVSNCLGKADMLREQEVRKVLTPLKRMAAEYGVAILLVMHLNKKSDQDAISRVGGAMAFIGVARSAWLFQRDEAEKTEENMDAPRPNTFTMTGIKANLVATGKGVKFSTKSKQIFARDGSPIFDEDGRPLCPAFVDWGEEINRSAQDVLRPQRRESGRPPKHTQAEIEGWLTNYLKDGDDHHSAEVKQAGREERGFTYDELRAAANRLGVLIHKAGKVWMWRIMHRPEPKYADAEPLSFVNVEGAA